MNALNIQENSKICKRTHFTRILLVEELYCTLMQQLNLLFRTRALFITTKKNVQLLLKQCCFSIVEQFFFISEIIVQVESESMIFKSNRIYAYAHIRAALETFN